MRKDVTYREPLMLFHNDGKTLRNVSAQSGPRLRPELSARGLAIGDFDNDGAVDVLISVNDAAPLLLRNHAGKDNHWLGVKLVGKKSNRDAIGARVTYQAGDLKRSQNKSGRRKLPVVARPANGARSGSADEDRLVGSEVAAAQRRDGKVH